MSRFWYYYLGYALAIRISDEEIDSLIRERKLLPDDYLLKLQLRVKGSHKRRDFDIVGENGNKFVIKLRQLTQNPLDFSVILGVYPENSSMLFRLRRYNGRHCHNNRIERSGLDGFHIHMATERYQDLGAKEEGFAESTGRYSDLGGALECLFADCGFEKPGAPQMPLFEEDRT